VHNGGAFGGHYFAYIKNLEDEMWHNFNDSNVNSISDNELMKCFGGDGMPNTAYMLLYRKVGGSKLIRNVPEIFINQNAVELEKVINE